MLGKSFYQESSAAHQQVIQRSKYLLCELLRTHQGKAMLTQFALDDSFLLGQKLD